MLASEPPASEFDLRFRLLGMPIRVHPMFWVITVVLAAGARPPDGISQAAVIAIWTAVVFVSILVHELGHAFAARAYGWQPWIVLHGFGGLALYRPTYRTAWSTLLIAAAGPLAGFLLALAAIAACRVTNSSASFWGLELGGTRPIDDWRIELAIGDLLYVNLLWGALNLLPIWPLDGGHIAHELLAKVAPRGAMQGALLLSAVTAAAVAALAWQLFRLPYTTFFFGYMAWTNLQSLSQIGRAR